MAAGREQRVGWWGALTLVFVEQTSKLLRRFQSAERVGPKVLTDQRDKKIGCGAHCKCVCKIERATVTPKSAVADSRQNVHRAKLRHTPGLYSFGIPCWSDEVLKLRRREMSHFAFPRRNFLPLLPLKPPYEISDTL